MLVLVPIWRMDVASARRLFGFSDTLTDGEVIKAVEQVRFQQRNHTEMPPWLQALAGFASVAEYDDSAVCFEDADEKSVLQHLITLIDASPDVPIVVFARAGDLVKQLRLRTVIHGLASAFSLDWASRFRDGGAWQPPALCGEPDAEAAILSLSTQGGEHVFQPWADDVQQADDACARALAIRELYQRGWF